jgi:GT2 family glycosyltransferase/ubiquinone/menaquinone biosynthesis C-methylase UbiE/glycosyltransferase involved in cell wall biosynthesis
MIGNHSQKITIEMEGYNRNMKFTGERFIPSEQGRIRLEHYHRYATVLDLVTEKVVLDLACGEGYGSALMSEVAHSVTGLDLADEAISHASSTYAFRNNLKFLQGSAHALPLSEASFDVVVSFETIEHLVEQAELLAEIRRVLRPEGVLVVSSPNRPIYSEQSGEHNEFHAKELDFYEFDELLKSQFPAVAYYGQRLMMGSVIQSMQGGQGSYHAWHDDGVSIKPNAAQLSEPVYFLAVCSINERHLPSLDPSVIYPEKNDLVNHYVGFAKWAQSLDKTVNERDGQISVLNQAVNERDGQISVLNQAVNERDGQISVLNQAVNERDGQISVLNQAVNERDGQITGLNQAVNERDGQISVLNQAVNKRDGQISNLMDGIVSRRKWAMRLDAERQEVTAKLQAVTAKLQAVTQSNSWRLTLPLREAMRWVSAPQQQTKRYIKGGLRVAKRVYRPLPLSSQAKATHPVVSVIIPIYGQIEYTLQCLASIRVNAQKVSFEVIVVDDCSPDNSAEALQYMSDINLIRNEKNEGFIRACNIGASAAKGDYLCFLNNDTEVAPAWLDELLRTFHEFPGTGLAGSKLLNPDGTLQEAGGIIWQDGSAWNFGRGQDQMLPVYNYAREVDYCSGASIMVPKSLFTELGGFDEHYLPAYCEDSDLALKIRDKGYRVIYQPLSAVIHYEGITSGTDTTRGAKAYQIENSKKLFERWKGPLKSHQASGVDADNAKDRMAKRRVLVLDLCTPTPNQDAGSVTAFNLMLLLREMSFQVTFIPEGNFLYMPEYTTALQRVGIEVLYAPYVTSVERHLKECGGRYDLALLFRPHVVEQNIKAIRKYCSKAKVLFHTVDLHFLRMQREAELKNDKAKIKQAAEIKQREFAAIRASDATIVHSTVELELLSPELPSERIHVFPLIMDVRGTNKCHSDRRDIVFVGGYQHTPNVDAVQFFVSEIMPLLRKQLPCLRFYAVGSKPPAEIEKLACEDVIITGFVEDLSPLLDKMRVSVAPLRYGAGIKGKIGSAMAVGLPVVATSLAAEGMSLTDGENILVADGAEAFAANVVRLYNDGALWDKLSQAGLEFSDQAWGADAAFQTLGNILNDVDIIALGVGRTPKLYGSLSSGPP